jgi:DNA-binding transcriptional LysR family regulator
MIDAKTAASPRARLSPQSRLKLPHLRLIAAIEDTGAVSAAALSLHMSQPAASRLIGEMEALFDAPLCERLARGVRLTPLGEALARHARSMLLQLAQAEQELADLRRGRRGSVSIGAVTAPAFDLVAPSIPRMREVAPEIELTVKIDSSNVLARDLLAARLDIILARVPEDLEAEAFDSVTLGVEEARLVVRLGHRLLAGGPASLEAVADEEWVMQPRGTSLRRRIEALFSNANLAPPRRILDTTSMTLSMMIAARSDAIAAISVEAANFACEGIAPGALAILPTSFAIVVQPFCLIKPRGRSLSPAAQAVYEVIKAQAKRARPPL